MLEIAGGILIAIAILLALRYILWALVIGIGLAILVGAWFALAAAVGEGWALGIFIAALVIWLGWSGNQDVEREKAKAEEEAQKAKDQEAEELAKRKKWAKEQREQKARIKKWRMDEEARKRQEDKYREASVEKMKKDRELCLKILKEGGDVIGLDGRKMTLKDFGVFESN